ncbi:DUF4828 domain-containing protein [Pediococcus damnosus]|uniref:DUF4828 domain-containing protein n=1 Tax=Pediococcus damnosus TaxID=51663 RepID=UPI00061E942C|nr:DUF4828 domain-containing protein [Pediococcus damnosus]AMV68617.1 hypothetical protein ADU73_0207 [Pediococcus damnosus]KJU75077.1 membrane protein [Pediococcus damnosus LMG 28219]GEA93972.1 DUF4828 domain-containing protein [Pediococcus damnosus]
MKPKSIALVVASFLTGILTSKKLHKQDLPDPDNPLFFVGSWNYRTNSSNRIHTVEIRPNFDLLIDKHPVKVKVESWDKYSITFLDNYGYHIRIRANEERPVSIYDETENETYPILFSNYKITKNP